MEIKAELFKPYTDEQRMKFIVENNHKKGYTIEEADKALLALGYSEEEKQEQEKQRIAMLSLTSADVERGIYKATGMDFDDIVAKVQEIASAEPLNDENGEALAMTIDIKALKIELKANNFYRGNPYVDQIGTLLGFTKEQLDAFFETGDYTKLQA